MANTPYEPKLPFQNLPEVQPNGKLWEVIAKDSRENWFWLNDQHQWQGSEPLRGSTWRTEEEAEVALACWKLLDSGRQ